MTPAFPLKSTVIRALNTATIVLVKPYVSRELPGWGHLYEAFVGDYRSDPRWRGQGMRSLRGKLHGYDMLLDLGSWSNRSTFFLGRFYDLPTQLALMALLRPGDTFVDVGANEGMMSLLAARLVGPTGRVVAFEPNPRPRAVFEATVARNRISNVTIEPVGLGSVDGTLTMTVPRVNSGEGSFGRPDYAPDDVDVISCEVRCGDDRLAEASPRLIKLDVEGFELFALRGLASVLARSKPALVMEIVPKHLQNADCSVEGLASFLRERGYRSYRLGLKKVGGKQHLDLRAADPSTDDGEFLWTHRENPIVVDGDIT